jgi:hypothetical protein
MENLKNFEEATESTLTTAILTSRIRKAASYEVEVQPRDIIAVPNKEGITVRIKNASEEELTPWSFRQLCELAGVPIKYAFKLNPPMVAINVNYMLRNVRQLPMRLLIENRGNWLTTNTLRAINGTTYARIWDHEILEPLETGIKHFSPFKARLSDTISSCTFLDEEVQKVGDDELRRGVRVMNSEVGASSVVVSMFWYRSKCDNGTIFGMRGHSYFTVIHRGSIAHKVANAVDKASLDLLGERELERMRLAARTSVHSMDYKRLSNLARLEESDAKAAINLINEEEEGRMSNVWEVSQGITALARKRGGTEGFRLERLAGKYIERSTR